jgi:transposase
MEMPRKNRPAAGTETAAEIRAAERATTPKPSKPSRRTFTAEYKLRILREADEALASGESGAVGALCRREGLYASHLITWRKQREAGELAALSKKRGRKPTRNPLADEVARLEREKAKLEEKLRKAEIVIDVQKKVAALLGNPFPETPEDEEPTS